MLAALQADSATISSGASINVRTDRPVIQGGPEASKIVGPPASGPIAARRPGGPVRDRESSPPDPGAERRHPSGLQRPKTPPVALVTAAARELSTTPAA